MFVPSGGHMDGRWLIWTFFVQTAARATGLAELCRTELFPTSKAIARVRQPSDVSSEGANTFGAQSRWQVRAHCGLPP